MRKKLKSIMIVMVCLLSVFTFSFASIKVFTTAKDNFENVVNFKAEARKITEYQDDYVYLDIFADIYVQDGYCRNLQYFVYFDSSILTFSSQNSIKNQGLKSSYNQFFSKTDAIIEDGTNASFAGIVLSDTTDKGILNGENLWLGTLAFLITSNLPSDIAYTKFVPITSGRSKLSASVKTQALMPSITHNGEIIIELFRPALFKLKDSAKYQIVNVILDLSDETKYIINTVKRNYYNPNELWFISKIQSETTISLFISQFDMQNQSFIIYNQYGDIVLEEYYDLTIIGTGWSIVIVDDNGNICDKLTIAVCGDLDRDGYTDYADLSMIIGILSYENPIDPIVLLAGDVDFSQNLDYFDVFLLLDHCNYTIDLYESFRIFY